VVLHSLSWAPLLIDYSVVQSHDMSTLDGWTIDGDYLYRNFGSTQNIHVVQDSDDVFLASWSPMAEKAFVAKPLSLLNAPLAQGLFRMLKGMLFRSGFYGPIFDPIRRQAFGLTVRWHSRPVEPAVWDTVERQAEQALCRWVQLDGTESPRGVASVLGNLVTAPIRAFSILWMSREPIGRRLRQALSGDISAMRRILWNVRRELALIMNRRVKQSAPPPPGSTG
jgi:hypothetical protein